MKLDDYSDYSFSLKWDELPKELQEQKIDRYIAHIQEVDESEQEMSRENAEWNIKAHFPMYF